MPGPVRIAILANGTQAKREISSVGTSLSGLGRLAKGGLAVAGIATLTTGLAGLAKSSVDLEAKYSTTMRLIGAATGATEAQMRSLNAQAVKLGADTSFSASDAADAMLELAKAGLDAKTIYGGGVAGTLTLAAAGGTDLATAATIASNALNTFGLSGKDVDSVAAALAGAANASTASVESLGQALSQVGPGATNAGLSLQETVAALAAFDNAGIKGSDAGTSLKTMLDRLVPATAAADIKMDELGISFVKADGSFKSLSQVAQILHDRLGPLSAEQRTYALRTIFGSDATRAATVLMKEGAAGVEKYTKAANDQSAAQKMAKTRMDGTAGAMERLSGAAETAKLRLGQELAPAVEQGADVLADKLVPGMEKAIDGGKKLVDAVTPAVKALADLAPAGDQVGGIFNNVLVPALSTASDLVADVAGFIDDLPGPLKQVGIEAGIAALVLPRLSASVTGVTATVGTGIARLKQFQAELTYTATRAQATAGAMSRLGGAAKTAAGIGGMVALTEGAKESNKAIGALEGAAGGALLGFSLGGPWGAAIGAGAGALLTLSTNTDKSASSLEAAKKPAIDFASSLNQITGAADEGTRALAYQSLAQDGTLRAAARLGVSARDVVSAVLGQEGAARRVQAAMEGVTGATVNWVDQYGVMHQVSDQSAADAQKLGGAILYTGQALKADTAATRDKALATYNLAKVLKGVPKQVRTKISTDANVTRRDVARLTAQYNLTPKQVRTILRATGVDTSVRGVQRLIEKLQETGKIKVEPNLKVGVDKATRAGRSAADRGGRSMVDALEKHLVKAKAELPQLNPSLRGATNSAKGVASQGGTQVGSALKSGVIAGFAGTQAQLVAQAVAAVRAAVAAAKKAGRIQSPSKETEYLGRMLGLGLVVGLEKTKGQTTASAQQLTAGLLTALSDQTPVQANLATIGDYISGQFDSLLESTTAGIERRYDRAQRTIDRKYKRTQARIKKNLDGKAEARALRNAENAYDRQSRQNEKARGKDTKAANAASSKALQQVLAGTAAQRQALAETVQLQKDIAASYDEQKQKLDGLIDSQRQYAESVRDGVVASGSLSTITQSGSTSLTRLLRDRRRALADARTFNTQMAQLTAAGLNQTDLKDLTDLAASQGAGAASKIAAALLKGGPDAIGELNTLNADLQTAGEQLGTSTASTLYDAGITAQKSLLDGLTNDAQAAIDKAAELGRQIAAGLAAGLAGAATLPTKEAKKNADKITKGTKNRFQIASPSRVFRGIGRDVNRGLALGLSDTYVTTRAAGNLATTVTDSFGTPALDAYLASRAPATAAPDVMTDPAVGRDAPLIGQVIQQPGESAGVLADRLYFLLRTRG